LRSVPADARPRTRLAVIPGRVPPAGRFPEGCRFRPRCEHAIDDCARTRPEEAGVRRETASATGTAHRVRCLRVATGELDDRPDEKEAR
ncbi:oligopeptide/dipeptide ABC transporter ATP-binding protein, partial [Nonomuraea lactucae]|uniref:oligopeptide/dipeptide ABC transporter ATP-binding protein n=1 Tax=Nonomuraea lactucae TaxID=2249762 RepID=UPI0030841222